MAFECARSPCCPFDFFLRLALLTLDISSEVTDHLHLNYMFDLNHTFMIDGARLGNETRYINHASGDRANTAAMSEFFRPGMSTFSTDLYFRMASADGLRRPPHRNLCR